MEIKILKLTALLFITFMAGCASDQPLNTPSGKPEVLIQSKDKATIKDAAINEFINSGFTVEQESDSVLMFEKAMSDGSGIMYQALLGNANSSTPKWHVRVNVVQVGDQTRMLAQAFVRMQNAFGKEESQDMTNGKSGHQLMEILSKVKVSVESQRK